jgi:hypothetical protein
LHSKRVKAFKLIYLADPKRSVNTTLFGLEADRSSIATGAVLSQQNVNDNAWHPIAFLSMVLNPVERNYEIHDTEMLAII